MNDQKLLPYHDQVAMLEGIANNKVLQNKCGRDRKLFKIICMDALTIMDVNCPLYVTSKTMRSHLIDHMVGNC